MYHLLKGFHEYLTRKEEFSVIIIGLDGAGKTVRSAQHIASPSLADTLVDSTRENKNIV
jgi:ADP-ribosylation factor related protein 1